MASIKVLYIEDEPALAEIVKESLTAKGFEVSQVATLAKANIVYTKHLPDIIVADVMLPDGSGFDWVTAIRKKDLITPVIFLTSRSQTNDVVTGFELGGNDYLKKPFSIAELVVRINSLLKRKDHSILKHEIQNQTWQVGNYTFCYPSGELVLGNKTKQLTAREADLLQLLLVNKNVPLTRQEILQNLWGNTDYFSGRSLDVFISKLRRYLSRDRTIKIINIRGIGYKMIY